VTTNGDTPTSTLLLFDTRDTLHAALRTALHRTVHIVTAASGSAPLQAFLQHQPDAVVAALPLSSDESFNRGLRALRAATSCPLIVAANDEAAAEPLRRWADHALVAHSPELELCSVVAEILARTASVRSRAPADAVPGREAVATGRYDHFPSGRQVVQAGPFSIDEDQRRAYCEGNELTLTRTEFELLKLFTQHPSQVLTRALILEHVWGGWPGDDHLIDVHLSRLRSKILLASGLRALPAVRSVGFRLLDPTRE